MRKRTVICGIPMKERVDRTVYVSDDSSIPASDKPVRYPVNAFLAKTMQSGEQIKVVLTVKKDAHGYHERNTGYFKEELEDINASIGANISYIVVDTDFSQKKSVHEQLLGRMVDAFDIGSHILADATYGPKDLPIVLFTALHFAEKFLECKVDHIVYGQASFQDGQPVDTRLCDMIPLYCLGSVVNTIHTADPEKAKSMLKTLLSL